MNVIDTLKRLFDQYIAMQKAQALPTPEPAKPYNMEITPKVAAELIAHEAIVREAYKDSVGVWTWGVGVTDASGHKVGRYKDNPQPIRRVLEVYVWLLENKYAPAVRKAFAKRPLNESQFAAALSFHYNTGAIARASWVKDFLAGNMANAEANIMQWRSPPEIIGRRTKERDLFFKGKWSTDGTATVYGVRKPSYQPDFKASQRVNIMADLEALLA